ncbi:hypothetical protein ACFWYW_55075 [Nonomuraea sp. NPDC059023]|uniref:hypothetical protein n=1 Tax=unclassified Nonomuraea TaxID=2593643 RepID=UPI0036BF81E3
MRTVHTAITWRMKPSARKVWLVLHVSASVGWLGGCYAMLVMGVVALTSGGKPLRPAAYELMHVSDTAIMIPGSLAALITGLVLALYTKWRLLHHWWVITKLVLTVFAMVFGYAYTAQGVKAALAATLADPRADVGSLEPGLIAGSVVMLAVLFLATVLSVVKPWGRTVRGRARRGVSVVPAGRAGGP